MDSTTQRICTSCRAPFPITTYPRDTWQPDGISLVCLICRSTTPHAKAVTRTFVKRVSAGLCGRCGKNPIHLSHTKMFRRNPGRCLVCLKKQREYNRQHPQKQKQDSSAVHARKLRNRHLLTKEIQSRYGGECACCGEKEPLFLTIDHIYNDGAKHRSQLGSTTSAQLYNWLRRNGFPKDRYQLLCMNCNWGKGMNNGVCPHKEKEKCQT